LWDRIKKGESKSIINHAHEKTGGGGLREGVVCIKEAFNSTGAKGKGIRGAVTGKKKSPVASSKRRW